MSWKSMLGRWGVVSLGGAFWDRRLGYRRRLGLHIMSVGELWNFFGLSQVDQSVTAGAYEVAWRGFVVERKEEDSVTKFGFDSGKSAPRARGHSHVKALCNAIGMDLIL